MNIRTPSEATPRLESVMREPLASHFPELADALQGRRAYLFREDLMGPSGTFKRLGAAARVAAIHREQLYEGRRRHDQPLATASAGNAARGFLEAIAPLGLRGVVGVPTTAPVEKSLGLYSLWASLGRDPEDLEVVITGDTFNETLSAITDEYGGLPFVHPFDDELVAKGNGQALINARYAAPDLQHLFAPTGGGGLQYGLNWYAKGTNIKIWAAEAEGSDSLSQSLRRHSLSPLPATHPNPRFGGVAVTHVGRIPLTGLRRLGYEPSRIVTVEDEEAMELAEQYERHPVSQPLEPTTLLAVAALVRSLDRIPRHETIGVIATGHNESPKNLLVSQK